jgi:hypothetical protein
VIGASIHVNDRAPSGLSSTVQPHVSEAAVVGSLVAKPNPLAGFFGSVLTMAAICAVVQIHITGPSPYATILCCSESWLQKCAEIIVSVIRMVTSRSFVGIRSCMARYNVDRIELGVPLCACFSIPSSTGCQCTFV